MIEIYLFTDYRGQFYSSTRYKGSCVDIGLLKAAFKKLDIHLIVSSYSSIDFRTQNYENQWILYQSSEDPDLFYKGYIEDILLGFKLQGAKLIPGFFQFRAHHNKNFMEILRDLSSSDEIKKVRSKLFGTFEDYQKGIAHVGRDSLVFKSGTSSKSRGVALLKTGKDFKKIPKRFSYSFSLKNLRLLLSWIKDGDKPLFISNFRRKFILQKYIPNLKGDYRIIVYGKKFYVLYRENRPGDFRASGSRNFLSPENLPVNLLNFCEEVFQSFNVPFIAMDVGVSGNHFFLFEFQFLSFGQYTVEKSKFFFRKENGTWIKMHEEPILEKEIATSVKEYVCSNSHAESKSILKEEGI